MHQGSVLKKMLPWLVSMSQIHTRVSLLRMILAPAGTGHGLKLDFSLRTQFNITRRLLRDKSEILIVCHSNSFLCFVLIL
jgi:hypothetical protein